MAEALRGMICPICLGKGYTEEHDPSPDAHDEEGNCLGSCPVQVQCETCEGKGSKTLLEIATQLVYEALIDGETKVYCDERGIDPSYEDAHVRAKEIVSGNAWIKSWSDK